jgi:hypothetical protein
MDAFSRLIEMVPPPEHPYDAGNEEYLASAEVVLGLKLPANFKTLILTYGTGCWQGFWYILNPNTSNEYLNLIAQSQSLLPKGWSTLDAERIIRNQEQERYPHPIYPEPGGILPWATTDNGGRFFWLTIGEPDHWSTIYYADRAPDYCVYNMTSTELLYGAVSGTLPVFSGPFGPDFEYGRSDSFVPKRF